MKKLPMNNILSTISLIKVKWIGINANKDTKTILKVSCKIYSAKYRLNWFFIELVFLKLQRRFNRKFNSPEIILATTVAMNTIFTMLSSRMVVRIVNIPKSTPADKREENANLIGSLYILIESTTGLKCDDELSFKYTVSIGTNSSVVPSLADLVRNIIS